MDSQRESLSAVDVQASGSGSDGISLSALAVAGSRWLAGLDPQPLCDDPWAGDLAGSEGRELADRLNDQSMANKLLIGLRTAYFDRQIRHHVHDLEFRQVVILGAGLDTRSARLSAPGVTYFEVDRAETQAFKLRRLETLEDYPANAARYVECDLEHEEVLRALTAAGFTLDQPAFFLMEGLSSYLTEGAVRRLLSTLSTSVDVRSRVVFDYLRPSALGASTSPATLLSVAASLRQSEPVRWLCADPTPLLRDLGFEYVRTLPVEHLGLRESGELAHGIDAKHYSIAHATRTSPSAAHVCW